MALGTMVLGGLVAGPALAIFGHIVGNKGEETLNRARSNREQAETIHAEARVMVSKLEAIQKIVSLANKTFSSASTHLRRAVHDLRKAIEAEGEDYKLFSPGNREAVFRSVKFAQLIKAMIDTPILDQDGNLVLATEKRLHEIKGALS
jgi:acyl-CoA hydrolase